MMLRALNTYIKKPILVILLAIFLCTAPFTSRRAEAICCGCCSCLTDVEFPDDLIDWIEDWIDINLYIFIEFSNFNGTQIFTDSTDFHRSKNQKPKTNGQ